MKPFSGLACFLTFAASPLIAAPLEVSATNSLSLSRPSQTLELSAALLAPLGAKSLDLIHVHDAAGGELLCQAIDLDGDPLRRFDAVIFQADFAAGETKSFQISAGGKQVFRKEQFKAFGRFVRERFDDFTWENDRVAHRTYGQALETWQGEPLTSSTIDIWSKRTPRMVINDWYLADDYHADHGEGADFYSAGLSRGCGGGGLWADGKLWTSKNFIRSKVLANGPIRVLFELEYAPFPAADRSVSETKRISLDAGQQFSRIESRYGSAGLTAAIGLKKEKGETVAKDESRGWLAKWEAVAKRGGNQGLAVIVRPADFEKTAEDALNHLVLAKTDAQHTVTCWTGFCWDKAGLFTDAQSWNRHVDEFAQGLASPIVATVSVGHFPDWPVGTSPAEVGKRVAENILPRKFRFEAIPAKAALGIIYPEVISWYGALTVAQLTGDASLGERLVQKFEPFLTEPESRRINRAAHVDYRVLGAVPLEIFLQTKDRRCKELGLGLADAQWDTTTPDGITAEARYWIDDMYMIPLIQVQAFRASGDVTYLDRASLAMAAYLDQMQQPNGLFHHGTNAHFFWGRGNGWMAAGAAELLRSLPASHPRYARILEGYRKMMAGLLANQTKDGMWLQLIDQPASWPESSGTAMFAFAMVTGVKSGWLDAGSYGPAARKAWLALVSRLDANGDLRDVCIGTDKGFSEQFYLDRPRTSGDLHGQAPMLWTASALLR